MGEQGKPPKTVANRASTHVVHPATVEYVESRILVIRHQRVILDVDLDLRDKRRRALHRKVVGRFSCERAYFSVSSCRNFIDTRGILS